MAKLDTTVYIYTIKRFLRWILLGITLSNVDCNLSQYANKRIRVIHVIKNL